MVYFVGFMVFLFLLKSVFNMVRISKNDYPWLIEIPAPVIDVVLFIFNVAMVLWGGSFLL